VTPAGPQPGAPVRRLVRIVLCAACAAAAPAAGGCKDDRTDNSKVQTPNDAPIGAPKGVGGGQKAAVKGREAPLTQ
jgi:hypothetical protein